MIALRDWLALVVAVFAGALLLWATGLMLVHFWLARRWENPKLVSDRDRHGKDLGWLKRKKAA